MASPSPCTFLYTKILLHYAYSSVCQYREREKKEKQGKEKEKETDEGKRRKKIVPS